jgi:hypothetical protein
VFLSIACAEAIALVDTAAITAAGAGTFMGEAPITCGKQFRAAGLNWPGFAPA